MTNEGTRDDMVERIAHALCAHDSGPVGSSLFTIHWEEFGAAYENSARIAMAASGVEALIAENSRFRRALFGGNQTLPPGDLAASQGPKDAALSEQKGE